MNTGFNFLLNLFQRRQRLRITPPPPRVDLTLDQFRQREVEADEHEVLGDLVLEGVMDEDLLVELLAPAAPVGTGEVDEQVLLLGLGDLDRLVVVGDPALARQQRGTEEGDRREGTQEREHHG